MGSSIFIFEQGRFATIPDLQHCLPQGYTLQHIYESARLIQEAGHSHPQIVILVSNSCDDTILALIRNLKYATARVSVILIAQKVTNDFLGLALNSGLDEFLEYPFSKTELDFTIQKICTKQLSKPPTISKWFQAAEHGVNSFGRLLMRHFRKFGDRKVIKSLPALPLMEMQTPEKKPNCNTSQSLALEICFFGHFRVEINKERIEGWSGKKSKELFAFLAFKHKPVFREVLMEKFWPDVTAESARNCLNVTIHQIRETFCHFIKPEKIILFTKECYQLNPNITVWLDVDSFRKQWREGLTLEEAGDLERALIAYNSAISLYKGDLLEDFMYEEWTDLERENLKETFLLMLNKISHHYSINGKPEIAISICTQILNTDQCREDVHRRLIRCYYRTGQNDRAIKQFFKCESILKEHLGIIPSKLTLDLMKKIKSHSF